MEKQPYSMVSLGQNSKSVTGRGSLLRKKRVVLCMQAMNFHSPICPEFML
ncbi:Uncharacterised protein [Vibrio cholerae]|nr:Uncharacterised protein [Vibrio cholerae]CSI78818.1 Uncharacterised protein [Vibrio cholerae]CSI81496.1 Uncharacterised protein [Vibrio cholerae]